MVSPDGVQDLFSFTHLTFPSLSIPLPRIFSFPNLQRLHSVLLSVSVITILNHPGSNMDTTCYQSPFGQWAIDCKLCCNCKWRFVFYFFSHFMGTFSFVLLVENVSNNAIKQLVLLLILWEKIQAQFLLLYNISGRDTGLKDFQQQAVQFGRFCKPPWYRGLIGNK